MPAAKKTPKRDLSADMAADLIELRINHDPEDVELAPLKWPAGKAPKPVSPPSNHNLHASLPHADVLIITWTVADAKALADVLTPGVPSSAWTPYRKDWNAYEPHLTGRSPAHHAQRLASFALTEIDDKSVLCVKSELHLATDDDTLPVRRLVTQIVGDVQPELAISTGTAGGLGADTVLGDVLVTGTAKFNCTKRFAGVEFAQQRVESDQARTVKRVVTVEKLMAVNAGQLKPIATRPPKLILEGDVETVDFFAFGDETDSYGLLKNDKAARMVEMDDAVVGLVCSGEHFGLPFLLVRNASDPQVPHDPSLTAEAKWAANVYVKYGYWTTVGSAIACWGVVCSL